MGVKGWLQSTFSSRGKALSLYKSGMLRAKKHDHAGAIDSYTAAIDMPNAPSDVRAMALYNRALVHVATRNPAHAVDDLQAVLDMNEGVDQIKSAAKEKLEKIKRRQGKDTDK